VLGLGTLPTPTVVGFVGNGVRRLVERSLAAAGGATDEAGVDQALGLFLDWYGDHLLDATTAYPGIPEAVARLAADGRVLSIATNKPVRFADEILRRLGLAQYFRVVLGGDSLRRHKPDPSVVHELTHRTGVAPDTTVLVGDSLVDIDTARAAGIAVCAVTWGLTPPAVLRAADPDFVAERPDELLPLVG
jgi:phosphoglycolate phosphatase